MKIGILSMQKVKNIGSFLQAFSLKKTLEEMGADVYFVDIEKGREVVPAQSGGAAGLLSHIDRDFFRHLRSYFFYRKTLKLFDGLHENILCTCKHLDMGERFDTVIIGSDEVFGALNRTAWGFTTQLFGNVKNADRVVTYAASCGPTTYSAVCEKGLDGEIREAMKNLSAVSVRDRNTREFCESLCDKTVVENVDPVFLFDYTPYIPKLPRCRGYVLIYSYINRISDRGEIDAILEFAKARGLDVISVGRFQKWCKKNIQTTPFECLSYVINADYVVTDTFHGTVFSIKYAKQFCTMIRDSNTQKLSDLLCRFSLFDRVVKKPADIEKILTANYDKEAVAELIGVEKQRSLDYLSEVTGL